MGSSRLPLVLAACLCAVAACSSSGSSEPDSVDSTTGGTAPASSSSTESLSTEPASTEPPSTDSVTSDPVTVADGYADPGDVGALVSESLADIPATMLDTVGEGGSELYLADLTGVSNALRIAGPGPGRDIDDVIDMFVTMSGRGADGPTGLDLFGAIVPVDVFREPEAARDVIGLDVGSIERYVVFNAFSDEISVLRGDLAVGGDTTELTDTVRTLGEGADGEILDELTDFPLLPFPVRIGSTDGAVALSESTAAIEAWVSDAPTLAQDETYALIGDALDERRTLTAMILRDDFSFPAAWDGSSADLLAAVEPLVGIEHAFSTIGLGSGVSDGVATSSVVYAFDDAAGAAASVETIESMWAQIEIIGRSAPVTDFFGLTAVEQSGRLVVVDLVGVDGNSLRGLYEFVARNEPLTLYR